MNLKKTVILLGFVIIMVAARQTVFAEEAQVAPVDQEVITSNQQSPAQKESDMQWAWGEVTNLDNQAKTITLKYLDYETDQEKELVLVVDEKTSFENIKDFNELKLNDTLSIDYLIAEDSKNIAKNINFEKPEVTSVPDLVPGLPPQTAASNVVPLTAQQSAVVATIEANAAPVPAELTLTPTPAPALVEPASAEPESTSTVVGQAQ